MNREAYLEGYMHKQPEVLEEKPPKKKKAVPTREEGLHKLVNKTLKRKLNQ
jgi:hypothetical protein